MSDLPAEFLEPLLDLLRIPSVSTGEFDRAHIDQAAAFVRDFVIASGGQAELVGMDLPPLVIGWLPAKAANAKTVMIYGHYDVQGPEPLDEWDTDPFEPVVKDGRIYARGASDDKGNFWPLLYEACDMYAKGELGVNVRIVVEGEEESGGKNLFRWLHAYDEHCDACIIYDSGGVGSRPTITLGARGVMACNVKVTTADIDLHSGIYGGTVPNALHVLMRALEPIMPLDNGQLPEPLRAGIAPIPDDERAMWASNPPGDKAITRVGGRLLHETSGDRYYELTGYEPSLDVNQVRGGDPRTVIPSKAYAHVTMRLAPGQRQQDMSAEIERMVTGALHPAATAEFNWYGKVDAASFAPDSPVMLAGRSAYERAFGEPAALWRLGGTLPLLDILAKKHISTILSGFATGADKIHAPNESYPLASLERGRIGARALLEGFATDL